MPPVQPCLLPYPRATWAAGANGDRRRSLLPFAMAASALLACAVLAAAVPAGARSRSAATVALVAPAAAPAATSAAVVYTTPRGVWSLDAKGKRSHLSPFAAYAVAVGGDGQVYVGTGGVEAAARGIASSGVFALDPRGNATPIAALAAEDLEVEPAASLIVSNRDGVFRLDPATGAATQLSIVPTSRFALEPAASLLTTNGAEHGDVFGFQTARLSTPPGSGAPLSAAGGEGIEFALPWRYLSGFGGLYRLEGGALLPVYEDGPVLDFELAGDGSVYFAVADEYGASSGFDGGLYRLTAKGGVDRLDRGSVYALALRPPRPALSPTSPGSVTVASFFVPADQVVDTGLDLAPDQTLAIAASGSAGYGFEGDPACFGAPRTDPDGGRSVPAGGCPAKTAPSFPLGGGRVGLLLGRFDGGDWFGIGSQFTATVRRPALAAGPSSAGMRLYLGYNDDFVGDNQGGYDVTVTVTR